MMKTTNFKFAVVLVGLLGLAVFFSCQYDRATDLAAANAELRDEVARLKEAEETGKISEAQIAQAQSVDQAQQLELLRLRAQVTSLRAQLTRATNEALKSPSSLVERPEAVVSVGERSREDIRPRATFAHHWATAFVLYAMANQGRLPTDFDLAAPFLPDEAKSSTNVTTDEFEIVYRGSLGNLTNQDDVDVILLRERQLRRTHDGKWGRVYGLADGSSLQRFFDTESALTQWEQDHLRNSASP